MQITVEALAVLNAAAAVLVEVQAVLRANAFLLKYK